VARWDLRRYRRRGIRRLERRMLGTLQPDDLAGARVLEVGGGIGALQAELLLRGAETGEVLELVASYQPYARRLAEENGLGGRSAFRVLDLLDAPDEVGPADVVVLNRVVCCSPHGLELTAAAAGVTRRLLLLSFPRYRWWIRLGSRLQHVALQLVRRPFETFVRPAQSIVRAAESRGLRLVASGRDAVWEYVVLRR
jgi:magnesium-protoporphyrin O-methyltransferase